jgi:hypothetical protein
MMTKPSRSILDESFPYVSAAATSVSDTWRRFGWRPMTDEDRKRRRRRTAGAMAELATELKAIRSVA